MEKKNKEPFISIIIPTYNSATFLPRAIESCLSQNLDKYEIIVVDDGSIDNTKKVIENMHNKNIRYYYQKNSGPSAARNKGINEAKGEYILFLDSDDYFEKDFLKKIFKQVNVFDYEIVFFKTLRVENNTIIDTCNFDETEITGEEKKLLLEAIFNKFNKYFSLKGFDSPYGKIISRKLIEDNNIKFEENIIRFEDATFCYDLYNKASRMKFLPINGVNYVYRSDSLCNKYNENIENIIIDALKQLEKRSKEFKKDFYIKCITALSEIEILYYLNSKNKKSNSEKVEEFKKLIFKDPLKEALSSIKYSDLPIHYKLEVFLLRNKMINIYFICKKIHFKKNKVI